MKYGVMKRFLFDVFSYFAFFMRKWRKEVNAKIYGVYFSTWTESHFLLPISSPSIL
jgi:hypothetical protein